MRTRAALAAALTLLAVQPVSASDRTPDAGRGKALVEANCGGCHALDASGQSPHAEAPPFRDVFTRYEPELLAEALAEGISTGHPDMPEFVAEPDEIADIIAYLKTVAP